MDPAMRALLLDPKAQKKQAQQQKQQRKGKETQPNEGQNKEFQPVAQLQTPAGEIGSPFTSKTPQQSRIDAIPAKRTSKEPVDGDTADGSQADSGKAEDTEYTANRMIQDIYNVSERWGQARKRVKAEEDKKTGGGGFPREGRTGLGEYMKERSDNTPLSSQTVDLTLEDEKDDDDVVFVADREVPDTEVIYGRVEGASVYAFQVPHPQPTSMAFAGPGDWPAIACEIHRKPSQDYHIMVTDALGKTFGTLDPRVAGGLVPLLDATTMKIRATARLFVRKRKDGEQPGQPTSDVYRIMLNLYGPKRKAEQIGRHLGQKNVWLVQPLTVEAGFEVYNPHANARVNQAAAAYNRNNWNFQSETRTAEDINNEVNKMMDQLWSAQDIPEMDPPASVKTNLLKHQKQALWFMTEKEKPRKFKDTDGQDNSIWRKVIRSNGRTGYRDVISGITMPEEPDQVLGGLLADMMGLGKTLSILSLVVSSTEEAEQWAQGSERVTGRRMPKGDPGRLNIKTTLLVSPLSATNNWVEQAKEHLDGNCLSYYVFHGSTRTQDPEELGRYDLVITTYSTILSDLGGKSTKRGQSPLNQVNFFRIVLDEAHAIREQSTSQAQAIYTLEAQRRWAVTGTPVQNRLEDLSSITKFLRLYPFMDKSHFAAAIIAPFKSESPTAVNKLRVLVDSFTLRRIKDKVDLPERRDEIVTLKFSREEAALHEFFRRESNVKVNMIAGQHKQKMSGRMYHVVLKAMMMLRQISAHGKELLDQSEIDRYRNASRGNSADDAIDVETMDDIQGKRANDITNDEAYEVYALAKESSADLCAKCRKLTDLPSTDEHPEKKDAAVAYVIPCYDIFCADCFADYKPMFDEQAGSKNRVKCPFCSTEIHLLYTVITPVMFEKHQARKQEEKEKGTVRTKQAGEYGGPHTKTKALITYLLKDREWSEQHPNEKPVKSVIFSAWTSHLDLIEIALKENGLSNFVRLDGTMPLRQRNVAIDTFRDGDDIHIMLATIGAGGVGLNLSAANKVYIMEPQYNPAAVAQAVDRVHRIGQARAVTTVQFIMKDSIEEKMLEIMNKKQKLADLSLTRHKPSKQHQQEERMKEYRWLFT